MIHNGIEYGMMQAFAEGFDILKTKASERLPEDQRFDLNVADIAEVWRRGSVVSSWLLDLTADALASDPKLDGFSGSVADSGEGRWTIEAAMEQAVPVPVLSNSLFSRYRSRGQGTFGDKILSAQRFGFGGHVETPKNDPYDPQKIQGRTRTTDHAVSVRRPRRPGQAPADAGAVQPQSRRLADENCGSSALTTTPSPMKAFAQKLEDFIRTEAAAKVGKGDQMLDPACGPSSPKVSATSRAISWTTAPIPRWRQKSPTAALATRCSTWPPRHVFQ
jgi:hypothetical protein